VVLTNRASAPDLFLNELATAGALLVETPQLGRPYRLSPVPGVRRRLMRSTRYHLYYPVANDEITILAVWHDAEVPGRRYGRRSSGLSAPSSAVSASRAA
jgi:plasmid stabilization system protein ParE